MIVNNSGIRMFSKQVTFNFLQNQCDWVVPVSGVSYQDVIFVTPVDTSSSGDWATYRIGVTGASQAGDTLTLTIGCELEIPDGTSVDANVVIFY